MGSIILGSFPAVLERNTDLSMQRPWNELRDGNLMGDGGTEHVLQNGYPAPSSIGRKTRLGHGEVLGKKRGTALERNGVEGSRAKGRGAEKDGVQRERSGLCLAGLKACGGLKDQVYIHQTNTVASETLDSERQNCATEARQSTVESARANMSLGTSTNHRQPAKRRTNAGPYAAHRTGQTQVQTTHNSSITTKSKGHHVKVEGGQHARCMVRADETFRQNYDILDSTVSCSGSQTWGTENPAIEERSWRRPATTGVPGPWKPAGTAGYHALTKKQKGGRDAKTDPEEWRRK